MIDNFVSLVCNYTAMYRDGHTADRVVLCACVCVCVQGGREVRGCRGCYQLTGHYVRGFGFQMNSDPKTCARYQNDHSVPNKW